MTAETIGFIGLGVMGGPMCRNIAVKHAGPVMAFDLSQAALGALSDTKTRPATIAEIAQAADVICLSLPGGPQVEAVCAQLRAESLRPGTVVIDLSTTPVAAARSVDAALAAQGVAFADCPVARTREAAQRGELSIMVGTTPETFERIKPVLAYMASDITYGGEAGAGQVLKLVNNMLLFNNVVAIAEMLVLAERAGVAGSTVLEAVSKGSGDSFALRNHAAKAMLPRSFPDRAFAPEYVLKDISYIFEMAKEVGLPLEAAATARSYYERAIAEGYGGQYFPGVIRVLDHAKAEA